MSAENQKYNVLSYSEKSYIIKTLLENELSLSDVSSQFNIGESTLRDWLKIIEYDLQHLWNG